MKLKEVPSGFKLSSIIVPKDTVINLNRFHQRRDPRGRPTPRFSLDLSIEEILPLIVGEESLIDISGREVLIYKKLKDLESINMINYYFKQDFFNMHVAEHVLELRQRLAIVLYLIYDDFKNHKRKKYKKIIVGQIELPNMGVKTISVSKIDHTDFLVNHLSTFEVGHHIINI